MIRNRELEKVHKSITELLEENTEDIDNSTLNKLIEKCDEFGDIIYLPERWSDTKLVPSENFFCPGCSSPSLKTVLTDKVNRTASPDYRTLYKKTCKDCGHIYYVDAGGSKCSPEDIQTRLE